MRICERQKAPSKKQQNLQKLKLKLKNVSLFTHLHIYIAIINQIYIIIHYIVSKLTPKFFFMKNVISFLHFEGHIYIYMCDCHRK